MKEREQGTSRRRPSAGRRDPGDSSYQAWQRVQPVSTADVPAWLRIFASLLLVVLAGVVGWLGWRAWQRGGELPLPMQLEPTRAGVPASAPASAVVRSVAR
ncbi:hypothetical protein [Sphaerotilus uruguayifluvii]|uniref:Uncharacterized protein n=1 Tax=Sphaerotilus uruguayifluvii TaxID=2735897 RepID=A0ABX2G209_9BURK|nr:hypothetical protein [Leptothrix sp. C29]NRT55478.1 hypothetical protein [Leptothrix sp. C29]